MRLLPLLSVHGRLSGFRTPLCRANIAPHWLEAGARLVWVIDPVRRVARIYRADGTEITLGETASLDGEDVLSGFTCGLEAIL